MAFEKSRSGYRTVRNQIVKRLQSSIKEAKDVLNNQQLEESRLITSINYPVPQIAGLGLKNFEEKSGHFSQLLLADIEKI